MLTGLIIVAFVYPFVYAIRRFVIKESRYTGEVDGDMTTRPIKVVAVVVAVGLGIFAAAILLLLTHGKNDSGAISTTVAGTIIVAYYAMRR